ncbi:hypothetical protein GDO86_000756 [Hymenochirus boettgeri]|uniref:Uncharacterized protein n=1 Tax=Hymenochirus boettgeri TaxID=247094 RepID=A0A8T2KEC9_9PIPI|nr:hypothetical protein GDO86_000756 [Hymenochirus boettgeri]
MFSCTFLLCSDVEDLLLMLLKVTSSSNCLHFIVPYRVVCLVFFFFCTINGKPRGNYYPRLQKKMNASLPFSQGFPYWAISIHL